MTLVKSISSKLMTDLLEWRNSGWESHSKTPVSNTCIYLGKVISTEIGLGLLSAAAIVETLAYGVITFAIKAVSSSDEKSKFAVKLLESSAFTIPWAIIVFFTYNFSCQTIRTHESEARSISNSFHPFKFTFLRPEDSEHLALLTKERAAKQQRNEV